MEGNFAPLLICRNSWHTDLNSPPDSAGTRDSSHPGAAIPIFLIAFFTLTVFIYAGEHGLHGFGAGAFKPTWLIFLAAAPILIFNLEGFELPSAASEELVNPKRDVPFAVLRSGIATTAWCALTTIAIIYPGIGTAHPDDSLPEGFERQRLEYTLSQVIPLVVMILIGLLFYALGAPTRRQARADAVSSQAVPSTASAGTLASAPVKAHAVRASPVPTATRTRLTSTMIPASRTRRWMSPTSRVLAVHDDTSGAGVTSRTACPCRASNSASTPPR